jgi:hypothetical protein
MLAKNPYAVLKDLNWIEDDRKLQLGPAKRRLFAEQLIKDTEAQHSPSWLPRVSAESCSRVCSCCRSSACWITAC